MSDPWLKTAETQIDPWLKTATEEQEPSVIQATPVEPGAYIEELPPLMPMPRPTTPLPGPEFITTPEDIRGISPKRIEQEKLDAEALERYYEAHPEIKPRKYKNFFDEMFRTGIGMTMRMGAAGLGQTGELLEQTWGTPGIEVDTKKYPLSPRALQKYAWQLYFKAKEPAFTPSEGGGWRGFVAASVGQAAPYMGAAVGATMLTGTPIAAFGVGYTIEGDEAYRTAIELGATEEEAQLRRFIVGTINGAIEQIQVSQVFKFARAGRGSAKGVLKAASDRAWKKVLAKGGKVGYEGLKHSAIEGLEEVLQETTHIASEAKYNPEVWDTATQRILMSGLGGATVGLLLGGGGRVMANLRAKAEAGKLTPQQLEVMNQTKNEYDTIVAEGGIGANQKAREVVRKGQAELAALEGEEAAAAFEAEVAEMDTELREIQRPAEVAEKPPQPPPVAITLEKPPTVSAEAPAGKLPAKITSGYPPTEFEFTGRWSIQERRARHIPTPTVKGQLRKAGKIKVPIYKSADGKEILYMEGAVKEPAPTPAKVEKPAEPTEGVKPAEVYERFYKRLSKKLEQEGIAKEVHEQLVESKALVNPIHQKFWNEIYPKLSRVNQKKFEEMLNAAWHTAEDKTDWTPKQWQGLAQQLISETSPSELVENLTGGERGMVALESLANQEYERLEAAPIPAKVEKPVPEPTLREPSVISKKPLKEQIKEREAETATEITGISNRRRNRLMKEIAEEIKQDDIYQVELEGLETKIGPGYYFVPEKFRSEVEDIIGKRKGFPTKAQAMFTFDPYAKKIVDTPEGKAGIGPLPWETAVQQALGRGREGVEETWGEMDISDFVQQVKDSAELEEDKYGLNQKALDKVSQKASELYPYKQYRIAKFEMLRDGRTVTEIDEMTKEWAEHYGLDESEIENEFLGPEPLKLKEIKALPEAEQDKAIEALARENVLKNERQEAKQAVNEVLKANDIEVEVEEVAEIKEGEEVPFERRGKPTGAAIITPVGREIVQLAYGADSETGYHEAYHILRAHLTPKDIKVLDMRFKGDTEAEAREFAEFAKTGKTKVGYLRAIWRKLVEKLRKIKSALQGRGYRTANDIFGEIQRGVVPKEGARPGEVQFERGVFGQPIEEQLRLPFKERLAAIKKVAVQEAKRKAKPTEEKLARVETEYITNSQFDSALKRQERKNLKEFGQSLSFASMSGRLRDYIIEERTDEGTLVIKKGWREKIKTLVPTTPYEEWRPKGVVPIKSALIKAVDAEIARTMKPRSNTVNITPEEIAAKLRRKAEDRLFYEEEGVKPARLSELFYDTGNPLPEVTEAFNQLVKGGPLIQFETTGDRLRRESIRNAQIKAEKARLKARITPKARRGRIKIQIDETTTPFLTDDLKPTVAKPVPKPRDGVPTPKLTQQWFEQNVGKEKLRIMGRVSSSAKEISTEVGKRIWSSSSQLYRIHPELFRRVRSYASRWMNRTSDMLRDAEPFLKKFRKLRHTNLKDWQQLDLALKNSQAWKAEEIIAKHNMVAEYEAVKDDIYKAIAEAWKTLGGDPLNRADYWHREIRDIKGFLKHFYDSEDWSVIEQALKNRARRAGRDVADLTDEEKAQVINTLLRGYQTQAVTLARPGAVKERLVQTVDKNINRFYYDSGSALVRYIQQMNQAIAQREFFGRETKIIQQLRTQQSRRLSQLMKLKRREGLKPGTTEARYKEKIAEVQEALKASQERLERLQARDLTHTIGGYVGKLKDQGYLTAEQERSTQNLIRGILQPKGMGRGMGLFATGVYIDVLNNSIQAITQLDEYAFSIIMSPRYAIPAGVKTILRKNPITLRDLGIMGIGAEYQQASLRKSLGSLLTSTAFRGVDVFGKEALANTALMKYQAQARKEKLNPSFVKEMRRVFGPEQYKQVIEDLRKPIKSAADASANVRYLLFNAVLDRQPIGHTETPVKYNLGGNARIFWMLKTFYMKRLDFVRNQTFEDMKHAKTFHRGFSKVVWITAAFAFLGASSDELKDFILGRKISFSDHLWDNALKMIMFGKYHVYKAQMEGIGRTIFEAIIPPTKAIDAATKDVVTIAKDKDRGFELWRSVPLVGEQYYWWFGRGREKIEKKTGKRPTRPKKPTRPTRPSRPTG